MAEQDKREEAPEEGTPPAETGAGEAQEAAQPTEARQRAPAAGAERRPARPGAGAAPAGPPTAIVLPRQVPGQPIVTRRRILQIGFWSSLGAAVAAAGACGLDLLYPKEVTGFGGTISVNSGDVPPPGGKKEIAEGRFWLIHLTEEQGGPGLLALWWKCPHLGCTVPWKPTFVWPDPTTGAPKQGWFRCPCHGSTYTDAGIRVYGPAPRSMDTMDLVVNSDGGVTVNTGAITNGGPDNPDRVVRL